MEYREEESTSAPSQLQTGLASLASGFFGGMTKGRDNRLAAEAAASKAQAAADLRRELGYVPSREDYYKARTGLAEAQTEQVKEKTKSPQKFFKAPTAKAPTGPKAFAPGAYSAMVDKALKQFVPQGMTGDARLEYLRTNPEARINAERMIQTELSQRDPSMSKAKIFEVDPDTDEMGGGIFGFNQKPVKRPGKVRMAKFAGSTTPNTAKAPVDTEAKSFDPEIQQIVDLAKTGDQDSIEYLTANGIDWQ